MSIVLTSDDIPVKEKKEAKEEKKVENVMEMSLEEMAQKKRKRREENRPNKRPKKEETVRKEKSTPVKKEERKVVKRLVVKNDRVERLPVTKPTLRFSNLPDSVMPHHLAHLISPIGTVKELNLKYTPEGKPTGVAEVVMASFDEARDVVKELHGAELEEQKLHVVLIDDRRKKNPRPERVILVRNDRDRRSPRESRERQRGRGRGSFRGRGRGRGRGGRYQNRSTKSHNDMDDEMDRYRDNE